MMVSTLEQQLAMAQHLSIKARRHSSSFETITLIAAPITTVTTIATFSEATNADNAMNAANAAATATAHK
jgi:hypothetical protein